MRTLKGPAIFLAQFIADDEPFNTIDAMAQWAARQGYVGMQLPIGNSAFVDVALAAQSKDYCDELRERVAAHTRQLATDERMRPIRVSRNRPCFLPRRMIPGDAARGIARRPQTP